MITPSVKSLMGEFKKNTLEEEAVFKLTQTKDGVQVSANFNITKEMFDALLEAIIELKLEKEGDVETRRLLYYIAKKHGLLD